MTDRKLTDEQKIELARLMSDINGELELVVEFNGKEMTSISEKNTNYGNMTNVITELTEKMGNAMNVAMTKMRLTEQALRKDLSSDQIKEYENTRFPMALKVKYMGEYMIRTDSSVLAHQIPEAFESMSLTIQRGIDNAKNGVTESNMVKVKEIK